MMMPVTTLLALALALLVSNAVALDNDNDYTSTGDNTWRFASMRVDPTSAELAFRVDASPAALAGDVVARAAWRLAPQQGWHELRVESSPTQSSPKQAFAAGALEGRLSAPLVAAALRNSPLPDLANSPHLRAFVDAQYFWTRQMADREPGPYWNNVQYMFAQLDGMAAGLQAENVSVSAKDLYILNAGNSIDDLQTAFGVAKPKAGFGKCSALIRWTGTELFAAHATWTEFNQMIRIAKTYTFPFDGAMAKTIRFSSYPGFIWSSDDFYTTSQNMVILETTSDVVNQTLWKRLDPSTVITFLRTMVSNRLAYNAQLWGMTFSYAASGTYTNQWIAVDYKMIKNGQMPDSQVVWITEELPGSIHTADVSQIVKKSHFGSFNVWFLHSTFVESGLPQKVAQFGKWWSYECPRYYMFNRAAPNITTLEDMKKIMRFNEFHTDKEAGWPQRSGENAIAARSDLNPPGKYIFPALGPRCHGATDAKITSSVLMNNNQEFVAVSGPTHGGRDNLPVFSWDAPTAPCASYAHHGNPTSFDFDWITV